MATDEQAPDSFTLAGMGWIVLGEAVAAMPLLFAAAVTATVVVELFAWRAVVVIVVDGTAQTVMGISPGILVWLVSMFTMLCESVIYAALAVAMHRYVLLDETWSRGPSLAAARTFRFAAWLVVLQLAGVAVTLPFDLLKVTSGTGMAARLALLAAWIFVLLRVSLLYPAVALDGDAGGALAVLGRAWRLSRGHVWRLFWSSLFAALPLAIGLVILFVIVAVFAPPSGMAVLPAELNLTGRLVPALLQPFAVALEAAVLSWNYRFAMVKTTP